MKVRIVPIVSNYKERYRIVVISGDSFELDSQNQFPYIKYFRRYEDCAFFNVAIDEDNSWIINTSTEYGKDDINLLLKALENTERIVQEMQWSSVTEYHFRL
ncbi:MAG: hypothetical protein QXU79_01535 [Candidatus Micrarchaeaceae archaeon]